MRRFFLCLGIFATFGVLGRAEFCRQRGNIRRRNRVGRQSSNLYPGPGDPDGVATESDSSQRGAGDQTNQRRDHSGARAGAATDQCELRNLQWIDPNLTGARILGTHFDRYNDRSYRRVPRPPHPYGGTAAQVGEFADPSRSTPAPSGMSNRAMCPTRSALLGTQLIFNGTTFNQIRGTFFQRDSAYFAFPQYSGLNSSPR